MAAEPVTIGVSVMRAQPGQATQVELGLAAGATVREAVIASGLVSAGELERDAPAIGVFGQQRSLDAQVADGDRIEIYRLLTIEPKEARRLRAALRRKGKRS